jgi:hypothetical protein
MAMTSAMQLLLFAAAPTPAPPGPHVIQLTQNLLRAIDSGCVAPTIACQFTPMHPWVYVSAICPFMTHELSPPPPVSSGSDWATYVTYVSDDVTCFEPEARGDPPPPPHFVFDLQAHPHRPSRLSRARSSIPQVLLRQRRHRHRHRTPQLHEVTPHPHIHTHTACALLLMPVPAAAPTCASSATTLPSSPTFDSPKFSMRGTMITQPLPRYTFPSSRSLCLLLPPSPTAPTPPPAAAATPRASTRRRACGSCLPVRRPTRGTMGGVWCTCTALRTSKSKRLSSARCRGQGWGKRGEGGGREGEEGGPWLRLIPFNTV